MTVRWLRRAVCALPLATPVLLLAAAAEAANFDREPGFAYPTVTEAYAPRPFRPEQYVVYRTADAVTVDGQLDEDSWLEAASTVDFAHILSPAAYARPPVRTRARLLWDDANLYVAIELEEPHLVGHVVHKDAEIYDDNDIEMFIDVDGCIRSWNKGAELLFGFSADEGLGQSVTICFAGNRENLLNLLSNALRYNQPDGQVIIDCRPDGNGSLRIIVSDTGQGIPTEKHDQVFTPFDRLGFEESSVSGTGIGLNVTKQYVESKNGKIGFTGKIDDVGCKRLVVIKRRRNRIQQLRG